MRCPEEFSTSAFCSRNVIAWLCQLILLQHVPESVTYKLVCPIITQRQRKNSDKERERETLREKKKEERRERKRESGTKELNEGKEGKARERGERGERGEREGWVMWQGNGDDTRKTGRKRSTGTDHRKSRRREGRRRRGSEGGKGVGWRAGREEGWIRSGKEGLHEGVNEGECEGGGEGTEGNARRRRQRRGDGVERRKDAGERGGGRGEEGVGRGEGREGEEGGKGRHTRKENRRTNYKGKDMTWNKHVRLHKYNETGQRGKKKVAYRKETQSEIESGSRGYDFQLSYEIDIILNYQD